MNNQGKIAVMQIMILLIGIVSFSYLVGAAPKVPSSTGTAATGSPWYSNLLGFGEATGGVSAGVAAGAQAAGDSIYSKLLARGLSPQEAISTIRDSRGVHDLSTYAGPDKPMTGEATLGQGNFMDGFVSALSWGVIAYSVVQLAGPMFGLEDYEVEALSKASGWGFFAGRSAYLISQSYSNPYAGGIGFGTGALVLLAVYSYEYEEVAYKVTTFSCGQWEAPVGGDYCKLCNDQVLPCSAYQCRSLGQACQLLNDEETGEEKCVWVNPQDVEPPIIKLNTDDLISAEYSYSDDRAVSPPDSGVRILYSGSSDGCIPAFTALSFGINTTDKNDNPEPSKCKIDILRRSDFDSMGFYMGGSSLFDEHHSHVMSLPGVANTNSENITLRNDGNFELYVRCQDANGNYNQGNFVFKYCVDKGPDTSPPVVLDTSVTEGMPVAKGQDNVEIELYMNEPSECRWSQNDEAYDNMIEELECETELININARQAYRCIGTLTGIKDQQDNNFYFRCSDQPSAVEENRNTNTESYALNLIGTRELYIDTVEPNETTVRDSTESVKVTLDVTTSAGYKEGEAVCYYGEEGQEPNLEFFNTNSYVHSTDLYLAEGEYNYLVKCVDLGGNSDTAEISFEVESDAEAPLVVRAYKETNYLKVITDEDAECVYDTSDCGYLFEDGIPLTIDIEDSTNHFTDWNTKTKYYVKCQDEYGNKPSPNQCSAIIRLVE